VFPKLAGTILIEARRRPFFRSLTNQNIGEIFVSVRL
jgi:hypothetical protein